MTKNYLDLNLINLNYQSLNIKDEIRAFFLIYIHCFQQLSPHKPFKNRSLTHINNRYANTIWERSDWLPLTDGFAGPLPLAVAQTHALQHVAPRLVGSPPGVPDLVGRPALVTAIWWENRQQTPLNRPRVRVCVRGEGKRFRRGKSLNYAESHACFHPS